MCAVADVLRVKPAARLKIKKNGVTQYDQAYTPVERAYTRHSGDRLVLATNMASPQEADLGDINTTNLGDGLLVTVSNTVTVYVGATTIGVPISKCIMLDGGSVSHLFFKNTSTTVEPTVEYVVAD